MGRKNSRISKSMYSRITALLLAAALILLSVPTNVIASIVDVSEYVDMDEDENLNSDQDDLVVEELIMEEDDTSTRSEEIATEETPAEIPEQEEVLPVEIIDFI